jgi:hypothetical protein
MRNVVSLMALCALTFASTRASAQSLYHRPSLGIEVPVLSIRQVSVSGAGATSTGMGLFPSGADLNGQYGLSNKSILGLRLGVSRQTSEVGGGTAAQSQISLAPRYEFYFKPDQATRPHLGIEVGFSRATAKGDAARTDWLIGPTGGVAYFANSNWQFDVNGSLFLTTGSYGPVSTSGYGFMLRADISAWFGGKSASAEAVPPAQGGLGLSGVASQTPPSDSNTKEWKGAAPVPPTNSPAPATNPSTTASTADAAQPAAPSATPEPTAAAAEALLTKEGKRLTLDLHDGRKVALVATTAGGEKKIKFILVKAPSDGSLKWCSTVDVHAAEQGESKVDVRYKLLSTPSGDVGTLSAELPIDALRPLVAAPLPKQPPEAPDHWFGVCGQNWPLSTAERRQLKEFLHKL